MTATPATGSVATPLPPDMPDSELAPSVAGIPACAPAPPVTPGKKAKRSVPPMAPERTAAQIAVPLPAVEARYSANGSSVAAPGMPVHGVASGQLPVACTAQTEQVISESTHGESQKHQYPAEQAPHSTTDRHYKDAGGGRGSDIAPEASSPDQQGYYVQPPSMHHGESLPHCPQCNFALESKARFCGQCGYHLSMRIPSCPLCRAPLEPTSKFCGECGSKVMPLISSQQLSPGGLSMPGDQTDTLQHGWLVKFLKYLEK